ncbi:MAG: hypothetical protein FK733_02075 [Asgard group archaeon]|nr:hypothetical protein [Asgard group archaeon]
MLESTIFRRTNLVIWRNAVAIVLGIVANSICNIGLVFKKKGACTLPEIEKQSVWQNIKNFAQCKTWLFGYVLTIIQWFPLMIAINLGGISLVAPTIGVGFVVLILFSWLFLKEPISYMEIIGIFVIIAAIITLYTGPLFDSLSYDLEGINQLFRHPRGYGFIIGYALVIATLFGATFGRKYKQAGFFLGFASGLSYGLATIFAKGATGSLVFTNWQAFVDNSLRQAEWWAYLGFMILFYTIAFTSQQMAFQKGKAIVVSPTLDTMNLFLQVTAGIIVFQEWTATWWSTLLLWQKTLKIGALILIVLGVALLSSSTALHREPYKEGDDKKKDEETKVEEQALEEESIEEDEPEVEMIIPVKHERRDETHPLPSGQHNKLL